MNLSSKYLRAWLSFNTSPTEDAKLNQWTTYGNPTISTTNAFNGKALQLDGSSYLKLANVELGGQDFYIDGWVYVDSSSPNNARVVHIVNPSTGCVFVSVCKNANDATKLDFWANSYADVSKDYGYTYVSSINSVGTRVHFKLIYRYSDKRLSFCINDKIAADWTSQVPQYNRQTVDIYIGALPNGNQGLIGTVDELRIYDGTWFTYNYGTPPTLADYQELIFTADVQRKIENEPLVWRYVNAGDANDLLTSSTTLTDLPDTQSKTGTAFYQTAREKCFDLPATPEIWLKFDVYFDGSNRWRAFNGGDNSNPYNVGVTAQTDGTLSLVQNSAVIQNTASICKKNKLQTVLLHMISGSSAGVIEAWVDGDFIYRYTGDVNHGEPFADIYLQSDGAGTFFSNVIISNIEIDLGEGYQLIYFDSERRITKQVDIAFDVSRRVKNVTNVLFNADVLIQDVLPATLAADTERRVQRPFELDLDVEILDVFPVEVLLDVTRNILAKIKLMESDTSQYFSGDTSEPIGDTPVPIVIPSKVIPFAPDDSSTLQSLEISLSEQQLTDQVNFVSTAPFEIMQQFGGQYLDYANQMRVETIRQDGILYSCSCCSDIDELLYTQFNYKLDSGFVAFVPDYSTMTLRILPPYEETSETILRKGKASAHLQKIAALLGASEVICNFDDFVSTMNERQSDVTYQDLISQLFGWTSRLPQRLINTFLRNGKLYAIQRGKEDHVLDLSQADCSNPIIEKRLMRTMWGSGKSGIIPTTENDTISNKRTMPGQKVFPPPPSRSSDGKTSYIYHNVSGYGGIETGYALSSTETENDDGGRTIVDYFYDTIYGVYTCTSERSRTFDANGNKLDERTTIHDILTPSQQFSRMDDEDGNSIASNVSSNLPGFYNEWYWAKLPKEVGYEYDINKITGYNPLIDTEFPVLDADIYYQLIAAYAWLNRRTQVTISFDVYDYPHLIDFNDRILFGDYEFYLVNNTATSNARIRNKQSLRLVRWF